MPKEHVISFRIGEKKFNELTKMLEKDAPYCIDSVNQLARKVVEDILAGRLVFTDEIHRKGDLAAKKS